jgi:hypothetical protein
MWILDRSWRPTVKPPRHNQMKGQEAKKGAKRASRVNLSITNTPRTRATADHCLAPLGRFACISKSGRLLLHKVVVNDQIVLTGKLDREEQQ